jgi:hypothetical protein
MIIKKVLATMLATTLMAASVISASAATPTTKSSEPAKEEVKTVETKSEPQTEDPFEEVVSATKPVVIAGTTLKSDVAGSIALPKTAAIAGVVLRQASNTIKAAAGLASNEAPYVKAYEITAKKSPAAYASFNAAAAAAGATVLDAVNIDLGKMAGGKFSDLPAGVTVPTTIAVKNAGGRTLAVVKVLPGGATEILQDTDDNPNTVTFPITGGLAAYAVIAY